MSMREHDAIIHSLVDCYRSNREHVSHDGAVDRVREMGQEHNISAAQYAEAEMRMDNIDQ